MYLPQHHEESDRATLHALMRERPLGTWITTQSGGELLINHVPFLFAAERGELGTLTGHVARANPAWQSFSRTIESVVVFHGPQAYVTPSWYPSKRSHGKAVPTWNYAVVHARGMPRVIDDHGWLLEHLRQLTETHEARQADPWTMADAPADFIGRLLESIVGIEIPIARLTGKWKISQNRPRPDQLGVIEGLAAQDDVESQAMSALMRHHLDAPDETQG